jgi:gentisate 1,2-dioxygenase
MSDKPSTRHNIDPARQEFYRRLAPDHVGPLWEVLATLVTAEPDTLTQAHLWRYEKLRPRLLEACELITAKEAERRVLVLENPAFPGESKITRSLFSGLQIILPGEVAPPHRHVQAALRFVIEGKGAYTSVDGERTMMEPGDFVITPSWTFHDHGNIGSGPMVWLDGLDVPVVQLFEASFREGMGDEPQATDRPEGDSFSRYGSNLMPVDDDYARPTSPVFNYPYRRTREALESMKRRDKWSPWHGLKMRYVNPKTGDYAIPTMATFIQLLPKAFKTASYRCTSGTVFVCTEGRGRSVIGDKPFDWGPRDIFVVPSWVPVVHEATDESVLFSFSDQGIQEKLGFFREQKVKA